MEPSYDGTYLRFLTYSFRCQFSLDRSSQLDLNLLYFFLANSSSLYSTSNSYSIPFTKLLFNLYRSNISYASLNITMVVIKYLTLYWHHPDLLEVGFFILLLNYAFQFIQVLVLVGPSLQVPNLYELLLCFLLEGAVGSLQCHTINLVVLLPLCEELHLFLQGLFLTLVGLRL